MSVNDPPFEKAVSSVGSLPMPSIAGLRVVGAIPFGSSDSEPSRRSVPVSAEEATARDYQLCARREGSRGAQDRRITRTGRAGLSEYKRHYRPLLAGSRTERECQLPSDYVRPLMVDKGPPHVAAVGELSRVTPDWATHLQGHVATPPLQPRHSALPIGPLVPRAEVRRGVRARTRH